MIDGRGKALAAVQAGRVARDGRGARVVALTRYFPPDYSGAATQLAAVIDGLRRHSISFTVLAPGRGSSCSQPQPGLTVRRFSVPGSGPLAELIFSLRSALWLLLHRHWDLLHAIDFHFQTLAPWAVARLLGRPTLVKTTLLEEEQEEGGSLGARIGRGVRRVGYRGADAVVALSDALETQLRQDYQVRGRVLRIPNGVDTDCFRPPGPGERAARRRALGVPEPAFVAVLCAMRIERKNALALVRAVARMQERPVHVLLVGPPGPEAGYQERLQAAIRALPAGATARLIDELPVAEVAETLRAADVYVLPSAREGLPNSVLEAMATGLACVASDIPGCRDALSEGGGILFPPGDEGALADALDRLAADPEARRRMGDEGLLRVRERYALDRVAERYGAAYATLLGCGAADDDARA